MPDWNTKMLAMLLAAEGPEGEHRYRWANSTHRGVSLLHTAAAYNALPNISVLLRAGADETAIAPTGETPHGAVGCYVNEQNTHGTGDPAENAAVHRMLSQGPPAFRALSFLWPTTAADNGGGILDDGGGLANTAVCSSKSVARDVPLRVRYWRPRRRQFFVRLISRCVQSSYYLSDMRCTKGASLAA